MTLLTRRGPFFSDIARVQEGLARAIDQGLGLGSGESMGWTPACDVQETPEAILFKFELAGVEPKEVDVRYENGVLTLKGERKLAREEKDGQLHRAELSSGAFTRSFALPASSIDPDRIKAEAKNGILTVTLPKRAEVKARPIQVKIEGQ